MDSTSSDSQPSIQCHAVAIPFPGRGHINTMMNFCLKLASKQPNLLITFIVTEEWFGFLSSETEVPPNISFGTIPNAIPSELVRAADHSGFVEATLTKMEEPVEWLIHRLDPRPVVIIYDYFLLWVPELGNKKSIPVASLCPISAKVFSMQMHHHLLVQNGDLPVYNMSEQGENEVDYIPGVPSTRILDLPSSFYGRGQEILPGIIKAISLIRKTQFLLLTYVYELEQQAIEVLRAEFSMPVYAIGPAIPDFKTRKKCSTTNNDAPHYIKWLDNQPKDSVLYISQGSFLSVSSDQLDEIVAGVLDSGVSYLWVTKNKASRINGKKGLAVPWCDQLRVLCHPSVGGFWSHCGWNSTKEGLFAGVPMLTFPIMFDQIPNSNTIVDDWKIGWRVKRPTAVERLVTRNEITKLVNRFMDLESEEGKMTRKRVKELEKIARQATAKGFVQATLTKMEEPVERLIGQLDLRPRLIIYDMFLMWIPGVGNRMNIPVASFWPMSATVFSMYQHRHLLVHNGHFPVTNLSEQGEDEVDYIPGVPTTRILDLPSLFYGRGQEILDNVFEAFSLATKAHFLLLTSVYELEKQVIDALRAEFCMPVYAIGPAIPYFQIKQNCSPANNDQDFPHYIKWLDSQPNDSVLYISQGSFLSVSSDQMDEIVAGVLDSGVSYLWVTRNMEASGIDSAKGLAVPWCDQLRVLCHPSVGGFWSHCGWNSTKEGVFAGVPMLTLPILSDQFTNSKVIVEDWKIGWRVKRRTLVETLVTRVEIARLVKGFMDLESDEGKEMRKRVKKLEQIAGQATAKGGSSENAINAFIGNVLPSDGH